MFLCKSIYFILATHKSMGVPKKPPILLCGSLISKIVSAYQHRRQSVAALAIDDTTNTAAWIVTVPVPPWNEMNVGVKYGLAGGYHLHPHR